MKPGGVQKGFFALSSDHYRAAQTAVDQHGERAEDEILENLKQMIERGDEEGVHLWMYVLEALQELQRAKPSTTRLH
jgi:hypothetical protein